jgi:hypothetical protein
MCLVGFSIRIYHDARSYERKICPVLVGMTAPSSIPLVARHSVVQYSTIQTQILLMRCTVCVCALYITACRPVHM